MIKLEDLSREGLCAVSFDILININQSIFTAHMAKENSEENLQEYSFVMQHLNKCLCLVA